MTKTLRDEIEDTLKHYYLYMKQCEIAADSKISRTSVKTALEDGNDFHNKIVEKIIATLRKHLPEKIKVGELKTTPEDYREGFNQAISEVQDMLGGDKYKEVMGL